MGVPINGLTVFINSFSAGVSAGVSTSANEDGTINAIGTVIAVGQTIQSVISLATSNLTTVLVPGVGAMPLS